MWNKQQKKEMHHSSFADKCHIGAHPSLAWTEWPKRNLHIVPVVMNEIYGWIQVLPLPNTLQGACLWHRDRSCLTTAHRSSRPTTWCPQPAAIFETWTAFLNTVGNDIHSIARYLSIGGCRESDKEKDQQKGYKSTKHVSNFLSTTSQTIIHKKRYL